MSEQDSHTTIADEAAVQAPSTPSNRMLLVLGGVSMLCGFLIVLIYQVTLGPIAENQRIAMEMAVDAVIPGAVTRKKLILTDQGIAAAELTKEKGQTIFATYGADGKLIAFAAEAAAPGYSGLVHLLYSYKPDCRCINGIKVQKMTETPGLGDKIITDKEFLKNFEALDAKLSADGTALEHPIVTVKHGAKRFNWEIDAISGSTVTSRAVGRALNQSAQNLLPKLLPQLDGLKQFSLPEVSK